MVVSTILSYLFPDIQANNEGQLLGESHARPSTFIAVSMCAPVSQVVYAFYASVNAGIAARVCIPVRNLAESFVCDK